jgi:hypothetical protein
MGTELQALTEELRIAAVLKRLLSGEATTIAGACELAEVPRSTFYALVGRGHADALLIELRQNMIAEVLGQGVAAIPTIMESIITDCSDKELTARDRHDAQRTFLAFVRHLTGTVREPEPSEDAAKWLKERGQSFSPVQINIHVGKEESPPIIEVEGSPMDG